MTNMLQLRSVRPTSDMSTGSVDFYDGLLLTINVEGPETDVREKKSLPAIPWYYENLVDKTPEEIGGRFTVELSGDHLLNRELFGGVRFR